ncbi:hypothetical protein CSB11_03075 [Candidatus Campbellbacteria bacterium]|nr:MAG: hypothetical protein CSB11_03075 [Candidatus Campbellbacteria bacterium]
MKKIILVLLALSPSFLFGKTFADFTSGIVDDLGNKLLVLAVGVAVLMFTWNMVMFIRDDGDKKKLFLSRVVFSLVVLFVIVSFWGILALLKGTFTDFNKTEADFNFEQEYLKS